MRTCSGFWTIEYSFLSTADLANLPISQRHVASIRRQWLIGAHKRFGGNPNERNRTENDTIGINVRQIARVLVTARISLASAVRSYNKLKSGTMEKTNSSRHLLIFETCMRKMRSLFLQRSFGETTARSLMFGEKIDFYSPDLIHLILGIMKEDLGRIWGTLWIIAELYGARLPPVSNAVPLFQWGTVLSHSLYIGLAAIDYNFIKIIINFARSRCFFHSIRVEISNHHQSSETSS